MPTKDKQTTAQPMMQRTLGTWTAITGEREIHGYAKNRTRSMCINETILDSLTRGNNRKVLLNSRNSKVRGVLSRVCLALRLEARANKRTDADNKCSIYSCAEANLEILCNKHGHVDSP